MYSCLIVFLYELRGGLCIALHCAIFPAGKYLCGIITSISAVIWIVIEEIYNEIDQNLIRALSNVLDFRNLLRFNRRVFLLPLCLSVISLCLQNCILKVFSIDFLRVKMFVCFIYLFYQDLLLSFYLRSNPCLVISK